MNEGPINPNNDMVETSDSLEAVGVFRGWKNLFFIVMVLCLLLTQVAFWTVNAGLIKAPAISPRRRPTPIRPARRKAKAPGS
jgi:predicted MFS family arabinose efflux permease